MQLHSIPEFHPIFLDSVGSTNDWAKKAWAEKTIKSGAVIVAETQTQGRGQMQTLWHDSPGENLLITFVIELSSFPADRFFSINEAVSLALMDVLEPMFKTKIKWPNDLYIGRKKVAGILMETSIQGGKINVAFIGIGLNVNQMQFPAKIEATSLAQTLGRPMDKSILLEKIMGAMKARLPLMYLPKKLSKQYAEKLMGTKEYCTYKSGSELFEATIHAVLDDGQLVLKEKHSQALRSFRFKEVEMVLSA